MRKKVLAILILYVIFSCATALAWDNTKTDSREIAIDMLEILDVMGGDTSPTHKNEDIITRGELADTVMRLSGAYDAKSYTTVFKDVSEDTEYAESISTLVSMGVIAKDENFNPKSPAKYEHAVKMVLYLLGYEPLIENNYNGDEFERVLKQAGNIKLTKDIQAKRGEDLNAGMLLALCYNALDCEIIEKDYNNSIVRSEDKTLLSEKFDIYKEKGIVKATSLTSLAGSGLIGSAQIGNVNLYDEDGIANDYLGMEVNAYYYSDNSKDNKLIYVYPTIKNKTLKIKAEHLLPDEEGFGYTTIYYEADKANKKEKVNVDSDADVIYNGKAYPSYTVDDYDIDMGYLKFVDNDGDSKADVVFIEEYENYVVDVVNLQSKKIYDIYDKTLDIGDADEVIIKDLYGGKMDISQIVKWNVLSVKASKDKQLINITVCDDPVTGEVERIYSEDSERYVTIDGDTFAVSKSYEATLTAHNANAKEIVLSQSATYYLDQDEKIAAVYFEFDPSWRYAYLIKAIYDENNETNILKVVYDNTGYKNLDVAKTVKIDGKQKKQGEIASYFNDTNDNTIPQLIKYKANGKGEVDGIDTPATGPGETSENLTKAVDNQTGYWSLRTRRVGIGGSFGVQIDYSKTIIFQVPESFEDKYNYDKYSIRTSAFENNEKIRYDAFDTDAAGLAKVAVIKQDSDTELGEHEADKLIIIKQVKDILDTDNDIRTMITGMDLSGKEINLKTTDSVDVSKLSAGDLIIYGQDYKKDILSLVYFYDHETGVAESKPTSKISFGDKDIGLHYTKSSTLFNTTGDYKLEWTGNARCYLTANVIADKAGSSIKAFKPDVEFAVGDINDFNQVQIFERSCLYYSSPPATVFLCKKNKVYIIDWDDMEEYIYSRNTDVRALLLSTYTQLRAVYIYE